MILQGMLLSLVVGATGGEIPDVHYVSKVVTKSWEPIAIKEVQAQVEQAVLEPLTAPGTMRLKKVKVSDLKGGAYALRINGRFVEEAERFTVYLSFGPAGQDNLPTLFAADTSKALGRKSRAEMMKRIRAAAKRAATRLSKSLTPWLQRTHIDIAPGDAAPQLPMRWGAIEIPPVTDRRKAIVTLMDPRQPDSARSRALLDLKGHVFDQQPARNAVEHCVLRDPAPKLRAQCVNALAPVARSHVPTQRILLHAMRSDVEDTVLDVLLKVSKGFVGLSRLETVATWLHMIASDATPSRAADKAARLLMKEKDVPNLEVAVAACLLQEAVVYGKRHACAQGLLKKIAPARRRPVVWRYLNQASVFGSGERMTYEDVLRAVVEDRKNPPDEVISERLLDLAERPATGRMRFKVIHLAGKFAPATATTIERLLKLSHETRLATNCISATMAVVRRNKALAPATLEAFTQLDARAKWYPRPSRSNPRQDLKKAQKRLRRMIEKGSR